MAKSPAQKAQWKRRYTLGTLTSLACWIKSKRSEIERFDIDPTRKATIQALSSQLQHELLEAASSLGWKPKPPPGYTAEELERDNPFNAWMRDVEI